MENAVERSTAPEKSLKIADGTGSVSIKLPEDSSVKCSTDEDSDDYSSKKPAFPNRFRSKRRNSIAPLPSFKLNDKTMLASDYDTQSVVSNQNSITSVNSLASLLREKMQALPHMIRRKKKETKDYKIKFFVIILFFIIIFLIGYAYIMYHRKLLAKTYFNNAKFNEEKRIFRIFDFHEEELIKAEFGKTFDTDKTPFDCLSDDIVHDGSLCLEWTGVARLYMNFENLKVFRCYTIKWQALGDNIYPTDCFELTRETGQWFGGGITRDMSWRFNDTDFDYAPFITGDTKVYQFGNALKRYFINSRGIAIQVSDKTPFHLGINQTENTMCLRARNDEFAFVNKITPLPELSYKVCIASDMKSLHNLMTQKSLWDGLKEADMKYLESLLDEPVWRIPHTSDQNSLNEALIYNFSESVIEMGYMRLGHILINEFWQENIGDFTVDENRFPTLKDTIDVLHRRGFKIIFTIQPFISTDSANFKDAVKNKLLIYERYSERSIPALTRYKTASSAGVLDITNNASMPWLTEKIKALVDKYQVDSFYLDLGTAYNLPHYYQCRKTLENPDEYARIFAERFESLGFMGISTATTVPKPPALVSLPPANSSWDGLRNLVTTAVNYGISGFPFILPGAVGGDFVFSRNTSKMISFFSMDSPPLPPEELYIRWLQIEIFLPTMSFNHLPSDYKSDYVTEVVKEMLSIRTKTVLPVIKKFLKHSMNDGLPLVQPLWMLDPHDPPCLTIDDEFSVGSELIVAPILEQGVDQREVYLPAGVWKDGIDGSLRKGSRWLHYYKVPKDKIAYFVKMPDNTRF